MTNEQLEQLRALVAAETLPDAIANIVYDMIPWRGSNDPASEAHRDYMYDKGCEVADAVLAHTRPALKALLDRLDALEDVARAARNVAETDDITLTACLADIFRVPEVKAALVVHAPELHDRVLSLCTIRREGATEWHAQYVLRCIKEGDAAQATPAKT